MSGGPLLSGITRKVQKLTLLSGVGGGGGGCIFEGINLNL